MKTTTVKCDRCGNEFLEEKWDGFELSIWWKGEYARGQMRSADWCRKCFAAIGECHEDDVPEVKPEERPSFEELVRQIIREEIEAC